MTEFMSAKQITLFGAANMAQAMEVPPAPGRLVPHKNWPFPGMTPEASAQSALTRSREFFEMLLAVFRCSGRERLSSQELLCMVPADWRNVCGQYTHSTIPAWVASEHGIECHRVEHDGGGGHFEYRAMNC